MRKNNRPRRGSTILDWLVVILFFSGIAAITIGLWRLHPSAGMIFLGISLLYVAGCVSFAANTSGKDGK